MPTYTRIVENKVYNSTLRIEGPEWDNTIIRNVTIQNVNGDGIFLLDVDNVRLENVTVVNVNGDGIRLSSEKSTSNVIITGSTIRNIGDDGINAGKRHTQGVDHPGLQIIDNVIDNTGTNGNSGLLHGMYIQSSDFLIDGNRVTNSTDGNGISVRSSGIVRDNYVENSGKSGIAYFADNMRGPSNRLTIENNTVIDSGNGEQRNDIDVLSVPSGKSSWAVRDVYVRNNTLTDTDGAAVGVGRGYVNVSTSNNSVVSEAEAKAQYGSGGGTPQPPQPPQPPQNPDRTVVGDSGKNTLVGGAGDDILTGRGGDDVFIIRKGGGSDTITDFAPAGNEVVRIEGYGFRSAGDLAPRAENSNGDVVIDLSSTDTLTLLDLRVSDLSSGDFIFG